MMSSSLATSPTSPVSPSFGEATALRQLRHQTKNALQRILCQIEQAREMQESGQGTPMGQRLVNELERRVRLSSAVSDALYGVVSEPGPLVGRLRALADATVELFGDVDQFLTVEVDVRCEAPKRMDDAVLRIAHEFLGNAVKHGMHMRSVGRITVRVDQVGHSTVRLQVLDDGWGACCAPAPGEGARIVEELAAGHRGTCSLVRRNGLTVAEALLRVR